MQHASDKSQHNVMDLQMDTTKRKELGDARSNLGIVFKESKYSAYYRVLNRMPIVKEKKR